MPPAGMPYHQGGQQVPYNGMPYPQQPMRQGMPYPNGNMNMPPQQNMPPVNNNTPKKSRKTSKKAKNKKMLITLGIFAVLGIVIGAFAFSLVNRYARQMTVIELPGAPIIAAATNNTSADTDGDGVEDVVEVNDSLDLSQMTSQKGEVWDGKSGTGPL